MKYYIYVEDNILKGAGCARCLNKEIQNIEVTETLCTDYISDNEKYIYSNGEIVKNQTNLTVKEFERFAKIKSKILKLAKPGLNITILKPMNSEMSYKP